MMTRRSLFAARASARCRRLGILALAAACVVAFAPPAESGRARIKAAGSPGNWKWDPSFKHIIKGSVVIWKNPTSVTHRVVAYSDNWKKNTELPSGERTRKRFRKTGAYLYRCTQPGHSTLSGGECSGMCGQIHVARR